MNNINSAFLSDGYKTSHPDQYIPGITKIVDNFTPRSDKHAPKACKGKGVLVVGIQMTLMELEQHFDNNFFFTKEREAIEQRSKEDGFVSTLLKGELEALKRKAIDPIRTEFSAYLNAPFDTKYFEQLWDLGYLPISVMALEEGTMCPIRVPMLTIHNTKEEFFWLPNFLETILSNLLWKPITSATIALAYRRIFNKWADKTNPEGKEFVVWQGHDFSMRGLDSIYATISSGIGHLSCFYGTDSLPTLQGARHYYLEEGFVGGSVPATEHSVMCAGSKEGELETFRRLLKTYPTGILSVVSDTWDLWNVCTDILPTLKDEILARDGKLVIRPDSGNPADILCGVNARKFKSMEDLRYYANDYFWTVFNDNCDSDSYMTDDDFYARVDDKFYLVKGKADIGKMHDYNDNDHYVVDDVEFEVIEFERDIKDIGVVELLWNLFGGTESSTGYKILDSHIGAIYGDSITHEIAEEICRRLEEKGFASTNVVFGIGSYTYQYNTRDTFGFAMKATYIEKLTDSGIVGEAIFKDPVTDSGMKKSAKGLVKVVEEDGKLVLKDECTWEEVFAEDNLLKPVYTSGGFRRHTDLTEIRDRVNKLLEE